MEKKKLREDIIIGERAGEKSVIFGSHHYCNTVSCRDSPLTHISLMSSLFLDFSLFLPYMWYCEMGEGGNSLWLQQECSKVVLPVLWSSALQLDLLITDETEAQNCRVGRVLLNRGVPQHFYSLSWLGCCGFMQKRSWCYSVCSFCLVSFFIWRVSWSEI